MELISGLKFIAAGIATIGMGMAGIGGGLVLGAFVMGISRNPSVKGELFPLALLSFALVESTGLFCLMVAFLLLFAL